MEIDHENDELIFDSGKRVYANRGIVGLALSTDEYDPGWLLTEGYDGGISTEGNPRIYESNLTHADQIELADYMIGLWKRFRSDL